jgi:tetratricopeptide (TPR) repeat protein
VKADIKPALIKGDKAMAVQSERLPNRPSFSRRRRHAHASGSHTEQPPVSTDKKTNSSFRKALSALLGKLSVSLGILVALLGLAVWVGSGFVLGKVFPEYEVTVQPFEISSEIANRPSLSGKSASDIVVDILNDAASHASQFHGTEYYKYDGTGAQPVSLHQQIKIPVQTSYGIAVKGVSVDSVLQLYDRARYQQWIIGGDILSSPEGLIGRIRLNQGDTARSWETLPSAHANPSELVQEATNMMLTSVAPELLGQAYLQQEKYVEAAKVFRQWEINDPQNWKPSYYLSLAYGYQKGKEQEASNLASWSNNIADHEKNRSSKKRRQTFGSENEIAANLAQTTKSVLETRDTPDSENTSDTLQHRLDTLQQAESRLDSLSKSNLTNVDYRIQRARVLDKEALIESDLDKNSPKAYEWAKQAIDSLDKAIQRVPENGGLHEQRAILLMHLVTIMTKQGKESPDDIRKTENEEVKEYTRALELRPTESSPLWGAVYAQIDLGNAEGAVDLARTITLLQPSQAASTAYIVALERAIKTPGKEPEREKEVGDRLEQLLQSNPDQSQLLAVWDAFKKNNDRKGLDLVAAEGRQRFPENATFDECKLESTVEVPFSAVSHW